MTDRTIGRYDVVRILGEGAMGVVYEARDPRLARRVAIKTVKHDDLTPAMADAYERRFLTEARSVARLNHPHIVRVFDAGQSGNDTFLVMELVQGVNLKHCLRRGVRFTPAGAVQVLLDMLDALGHAHGQKIIHRDIKPENILMDAFGTVKLTDFGIAKILDDEVDNGTQVAGKSIGTPRYMSPEQVRGLAVDERSDVFSAGVLLYELLTATQPFDGTHHMAIASQILHDHPTPPSAKVAEVPEVLDGIVRRALAKRPEDRYQNAQAFRAELLQAAAAEPDALLLGAVTSATQLVRPAFADTLRGLLARNAGAGLSGTDVPAAAPPPLSAQSASAEPTVATEPVLPPSGAHYPPADEGTVLYPSILPADAHEATVLTPGTQALLDMEASVPALATSPRRWPWVVGIGAVVVAAVWWWSASPTPKTVPTLVVDPAQTLSPKEELVPLAPLSGPASPPLPAGAEAAAPASTTQNGQVAVPPVQSAAPSSSPLPSTKPIDASKRGKDVSTTPAPGSVPAPAASSGAAGAMPEVPKPKPKLEPAAAVLPVPPAPAEPCPNLTFLERESCLWKACATEVFRQHPTCQRFNPESK